MANGLKRLSERVRDWARAYVLGSGMSPADMLFGHDDAQYAPGEYGDYLATSNAVYACVTLRSEMLASIPLRCYRLVKGRRIEVTRGAVVDLVQKVNKFWTMNRLLNMTEASLCLWGKAFWFIERGPGAKGAPEEIWWGRPDRVTVYVDPTRYVRGFGYTPENGGREILFRPDEVVWFRYPNPLDEFSGLSPLAAARLAADLASAAAKGNKLLFDQGLMLGGWVSPKTGRELTKEQAQELESRIGARYAGVDRAHRWGVFRFEMDMKSNSVTPKDAEFLGALAWSLEEVARAYHVPLDMIGGQRTYENVQAAERAFWFRTMEPESRFIASEIMEQLLPMFGTMGLGERVDVVEFDLSQVPILQDAEGERWAREYQQLERGVITVNEWRAQKGLEGVAWGDVWWAGAGLTAVKDAESLDDGGDNGSENGNDNGSENGNDNGEGSGKGDANQGEGEPRGAGGKWRMVEFGGGEHERLWRRFERRSGKAARKIKAMVKELWERQEMSVVQRLGAGGQESVRGQRSTEEPFDLKEWMEKFARRMRVALVEILEEVGEQVFEDLALKGAFDVEAPEVARFMERMAQRFAKEVNQTTWEDLRKTLAEGMEAGEGLEKLEDRVKETFTHYAEGDAEAGEKLSRLEMIARSESATAMNGGTIEAWKQSGVRLKKGWLAALDERTRDTHIEAHRRYQNDPIGLEEEFEVGAGRGMSPGNMGVAEEDINCRCTVTAVEIEEE